MDKLADEGFRTLMLAGKEVHPVYFKDWLRTFDENKYDEEKKQELYAELEKDLVLVGATAIEDKLQDNVPETIKFLRDTGIQVWVLTGDKIGTAFNIGMACKLLDNQMQHHFIAEPADTA
jgi:magnesium-transporting ATPase (P-type)